MSFQEEQSLFYSGGRIDWKRYLSRLKHSWWIVLLSAVLVSLAGYLIGVATYTPHYSSGTMMVISNKSSEKNNNSTVTSGDIQASQQLAKICRYALTSDQAVKHLNRVLAEQITAADLSQIVSVTYLDNTNFVRFEVITEDPARSYTIAHALTIVFPPALDTILGSEDSVTIANVPTMPTQPDRNNSSRLFAIVGFALGLFGVLFVFLIREYTTDTVASREDISRRLKIKLIGSIPVVREKGLLRRKVPSRLVTDRTADFLYVENFKALRTKLELAMKTESAQCFMITSTMAGEGKTTVSVNLALTLAQTNKKVLLIDADMRKPTVHSILGLDLGNGLIDVLQHNKRWEKLVVTKHHLDVLKSGGVSDTSSELIGSAKMAAFLQEARKVYDIIIIDSPPVHVVTDALVLTQYADIAVMVIREDYAAIPEISQAIDSLEQGSAKLIGCILNRTQLTDNIGYGRGYYRNYYGGYPNKNRL